MLTLLFILVATVHAAQLNVPDDYTTVQSALDASSAGDTVLVSRGIRYENLVSPSWGLTLASHYLLSQDTVDIAETILDGQGVDTVVNIDTDGTTLFLLVGFTIQHGRGYQSPTHNAEDKAGGVHVEGLAHAELQHLVFQENTSPTFGSAILAETMSPSQPDLVVRNITCFENPMDLQDIDSFFQINLGRFGSMLIENIRVDGRGFPGQGVRAIATEVLQAKNIGVRNTGRTIVAFGGDAFSQIKEVRIDSCFAINTSLSSSEDSCIVSNVVISNCSYGSFWNGQKTRMRGSPLLADSIVIENNR